jgi:TolB-like protein
MRTFLAELKRRNVIRVAIFYGAGAWLVLQVADVLLEILAAPEGSLRLVATLLGLGFPFALILAWVFELTPEGIKRESELDRDAMSAAQTSRKLDIATIALLVLAIGLLAWDQYADRGTTRDASAPSVAPVAADGAHDLSIAVLPFVNMSTDPENEYFSEGLSEELLNVLAKIDDFRVAGRTSSFAFKEQTQDLRAIGERLGVANILEGSVRKQGDRVRVTAQLIDARSGYHLWSDTYDRRLDDIFAIQDEIATEVVKALRRTLLAADEAVISQTAKGDVEAYNHYLRGQFHVRLRTRAGLERALEEFQQAIVVDAQYAPPYAGIAMVYALLDNYGYRSLGETWEAANRALERALALDPASDEAWAIRGLLLGQGPGASQRRAEARAALQRALEINPNNAMAHLWFAGALFPDFEAARQSLRRAYDLDPLSPVIIYRQAMEAMSRRDDAALERFQRELQEVAPEWFMTWQAAGMAARQFGRVAEAALAFERGRELNPEYVAGIIMLAVTLDLLGYERQAAELLDEAVRRADTEEARLARAALRTRQELVAAGPASAAAVYREAVESMDDPRESLAELGMLEINAGRAALVVEEMRAYLGVEDGRQPGTPDARTLLHHLALASALETLGEHEAAAGIGRGLRALIGDMQAQGISVPHLPLVDGYVGQLLGEPGALEAGLEEAIRLGSRVRPEVLDWLMPPGVDAATLERMKRAMADVLAEDRRRYDAAKATSG